MAKNLEGQKLPDRVILPYADYQALNEKMAQLESRLADLESQKSPEDPLVEKAKRSLITETAESLGWWAAALGSAGVLKGAAELANVDPMIKDNIWVLGFAFIGRYGGRLGSTLGTKIALEHEKSKSRYRKP